MITITLLIGAISLATVFLYGCIGEILMEKVGHLNLGIPGIMCLGTAGGCFGISIYMGTLSDPTKPVWILLILVAIFSSAIFSMFGGAIYAFLTVTLRCNQNITGLALTTFGSGLTQFIMSKFVDKTYFGHAGNVMSSGFVNDPNANPVLRLFFYGSLYKLYYAVNTNGTGCHFVYEHIGRMHILQCNTFGYIVNSLSRPIVAKTFFGS